MKQSIALGVASLSILCLLVTAPLMLGEVRLATCFSDNMVLQRDMPVPVWGTADSGERVTVEFAGQKKTTTADGSGNWMIKLDPLMASANPATFVAEGKNKIEFKNILVGEVWFCSGQSNMLASLERILKTKELNASIVERINQELATTTPGIRLLRVGVNKVTKVRNTWTECNPEALKNEIKGPQGFSAVGYFFGKKLREELNVPIGLIESAVGGTVIETWSPPDGKNFVPYVKPLPPFAIRGIIWYQGESNVIAANEGAKYADKMKELIEGWRNLWMRPELPFYYVQLPPMAYTKRNRPALLTTEALPQFREGQAMALRIPHTGMVITTDLAKAYDLHPTNKWDVGLRLALVALAQTYGRTDIEFSGPVYKVMQKTGNKIAITFDHIGGGLVSKGGGPLTDFQIAGSDRHFFPAQAGIEGDKVIVSSDKVSAPVAVRFAWHEESRPNFFNKAGLPAAPFRTDDWPVTINALGAGTGPATDDTAAKE